MGRPELDKRITGAMKTWGGNFDSDVGCSHDSSSDKVSKELTSKSVTLNPANMDPSKPKSGNPGVDRSFMNKGNPTMDTTGHGKLTRSCQD